MSRDKVRTRYSTDRSRRVTIHRRDDGTYGFCEEQFSDDPVENCWIPCRGHTNSFCSSEEIVIREAIGRVGWLGQMVARREPIDGLPEHPVTGSPPNRISGAAVICYSRIDQRHRHTGNCQQIRDSIIQGPAAALAICRYDNDSSCYLFGCAFEWNVITDTCHETIEDAKRQAEFEYSGVSETWLTNAER